jgi:hypothetical protein
MKKYRVDFLGCGFQVVALILVIPLLFSALLASEKRLPGEPMVLVIALSNEPGIPDGWLDSTTRPDMTDICNEMIKNMSKEYSNAIARSRCIIKVQME